MPERLWSADACDRLDLEPSRWPAGRGGRRRYFRIAVVSLNEIDRLFLRYNVAFLIRGAALCGAIEEAERALRTGEDAPVFRIFEDDWGMAQAAVLAARGSSVRHRRGVAHG